MANLTRSLCTITAVLLLLLATCPGTWASGAEGEQPGAFCVPDGWQSGRAVTLGVTKEGSSKPSVTRSLGDVIYSLSLQKLWIDDFMIGGGGVPMTRLYDYPGKILYTVRGNDGDTNQTCTKSPLLSPFQPLCVPANATMTKIKSYYGVTHPYVQFFMEFAGKTDSCGTNCDVSYRISLAREYQTPLFHQVWGKNHEGEKFFQTSEFYNSTVWGNMPPDIFTPPHACDNVSLMERPLSAAAAAAAAAAGGVHTLTPLLHLL